MPLIMNAVVYTVASVKFHSTCIQTRVRCPDDTTLISYEINHCPYRIVYEESHGYYILIWYLGRQEEKASEDILIFLQYIN